MPGKLWSNTREWHHKCEDHPVGSSMASGSPPIEWYAEWLLSLLIIHDKIDPYMPKCVRRSVLLADDIKSLGISPRLVPSAIQFSIDFQKDENEIMGFAYVLTGAHLMGGEIMRRRLKNYPTKHLTWDDRKAALEYLQSLRDCSQYTEGALNCFKTLYEIMEEILKISNNAPVVK